MATFVLVHGAWHGGWCWAGVERALCSMGHETHAPTLTGLGERSHLLTKDITPDTHVTDVVNTFKWRELSDVILVGHSYGGTIITGTAGQVPDQIKGLVYLDAFVPEQSGVSLFSKANPERMKAFQKQVDAGVDGIAPDLFDAWTDDPEKKAWLREMCTLQPIGCFGNGVTLSERENEIANKAFIIAARNKPSAFWAEYERVSGCQGWLTDEIATKHDAMVDDPAGLAAKLDGYARKWGAE